MKLRCFLFVAVAAFLAAPGLASPILIQNPAQPADGISNLQLNEQWRAGGDDDEEVFFGNVLQVIAAPDGGIYVLDSQLLQVFAFTADGQLRDTLGGRGEGPGEVNNVNSIVNLPDGGLGIGQVLPGVIACVTADGAPTGKIRIMDKEAPDSAFVLYMDGWALGQDLLTIAMRWRTSDEGSMSQDMYLRSYNTDGEPLVDFIHKETSFDLNNFRFSETGYDFVWTRCGVLPNGNVCFAEERNRYEIKICQPDGSLVRTITRPYKSVDRTKSEIEESRLSHAAVASHYGREVRGVDVENTEADIASLAAMNDGTLRVRTSGGDRNRESGVLTTVDEFDTGGHFVRQLRLIAEGDPLRDGIHMLPDGRVVVVKGAVEAYRREVDSERATDVLETETTLEVICYAPATD